ncbi:MAG: alpha/beta hydrolase [Longimicrobiales bacterium]
MTTLVRAAAAGVLLLAAQAPLGAAPAGRPAESARFDSADTLLINSSILGRQRRVFVSLPVSHAESTRRYPVLIVLDGEANFTAATTIATTLAGLAHTPEVIVVAIPNATSNPRDRVHDMTPPGLSVSGSSLNEGGDRFLDFIEKEVLPAVDGKYRGGGPRILVGHSSGGIIVTYAAATRTTSFPVVVSIDAPIHLGDNWLARRLTERTRAAGPPLRYVSLETRFGWSDATWSALKAAAPASWVLRREKLDGESHESMGFLSMYQGLKFAFHDYSIVGAPMVPRASAGAAFEHYRKLGEGLGAELPPPAGVLRRLIDDLLTEGRAGPARQALQWLYDGYGPPADRAQLEALFARVQTQLPLKETVDSLKATPWPTPQQIAPYVGEWRGYNWMNEEAQHRSGLRIRIVNNQVMAELLNWRDGNEHATPVEYLRVVPGGLHYGMMNGMRPMGMLVHEGVRNGNVLEGSSGFRGILLPLPNGRTPPRMQFRLEKQEK